MEIESYIVYTVRARTPTELKARTLALAQTKCMLLAVGLVDA